MGALWNRAKALFAGKKAPDAEKQPAAERSADEPAQPLRRPWTGEMVMQALDSGKRVEYPGYSAATVRMRWVSREQDGDGQPVQVRTPEEKTHIFPAVGFFAAGKPYASLSQLTARKDKDGLWCRDIYDRDVLCLRERFPCFDSADFLHENRYFRWFFLRQDGKLIRVQHTDERPIVTVTEDVENLERDAWERMQSLGYFQ